MPRPAGRALLRWRICPDGDRLIVFASNEGRSNHPSWYHNLVREPAVTVEVGEQRFNATAAVLGGQERDELFSRQVARIPAFGEYQANTTRVIPVIALQRAG